ncbi:hypothetical protein BCR33DRAFT_853067 [Rhizoclosmatium globosum]|uniref:Dynein regulatory complex protein 10 n=1 Tax=Rhizoclosmatium globosum TaxID=329046 RepID=A0A1Y2BYU0_9FUNG|nr:hypothetical protein BCR33DRAFT_853067 [Rhizoclosmatium globosum]|eukprot:ORY39943.1 hypothetical protein BCR33DRAFT_853067 [Rhizoclosmatium globosum]
MMNTASFPKEPPLPPIGATNSRASIAGGQIRRASSVQQSHNNSHGNGPSSILPNLPQQSQSGVIDDSQLTGKLINVEAQRIMSVLQEAQRKVMVIGMLPDEVDRRVSTVFAAETVAYIGEYKLLEAKYRNLVEGRAPDAEVKETAKQLRISTRTVCRHFLQNPPLIAKLRYLKSTKPNNILQFEGLLQEVKVLVYERLKTSVEEEKAKQDQLSVIIAKEQKTSNEVRLLKEELEKAKKERSAEVSKRNETIRRLKEELRDIKQQAEDTTKRLESRSKQKEDQELQLAKDKEINMKAEIAKLTEELQDMIKKDREEEALLRKKKFKVESEVENWIHKYDQDMSEKQNELEDITTIYTEEKAQLDELQARYNELQKEYDRIMEERRINKRSKLLTRRK